MTRKELEGEVPLIGFAGYIIEGGGSETPQKTKSLLYLYPPESKDLLHRIAEVYVQFLVGQLNAGARVMDLRASPRPSHLLSLKKIAQTNGYDVIGLDWCIEQSVAWETVGPNVTLPGNLDPNL